MSSKGSGNAAKISVAMATYNGERYLLPQLTSILSQLASTDEVIIVDDASTDRTIQLAESVRDPRLKVLRNPINQGVLHSFERALQSTVGDIVFLSDQDDIWEPDKVASVLDAFQNPAVSLVVSDASIIDADGNVQAPSFYQATGQFTGGLVSTLFRNRYMGCTMALRRSYLQRVLPFPSATPMHDMWIGIVNRIHGKVVFIDRPLMRYRRHPSNLSRSGNLWQKLQWRVVLGANLFRALFR